jgi:digeranylgeranylglycerophospholipid reductase
VILMQRFDVIIIGAGPAGAQCARELSQCGKKILLVEKSKNFSMNNYSSGGAPLEIMSSFMLPESVVGSFWNKFVLSSSNDRNVWEENVPLGVILDFKKLRSFLSQETQDNGGEVLLGWGYHSHETNKDYTNVCLKLNGARIFKEYQTKVLVDATGTEREIVSRKQIDRNSSLTATGIEHLLEVEPSIYQYYSTSLSFFLGQKWMPQGYAWIFPMKPNYLKVGVIRYFQYDNFVSHKSSYQFYLENLIKHSLHNTQYVVAEKHGKTLHYSYGRKDQHFEKNIIAIGDAISSLNPLGCEGIRHAMVSGRIAAEEIKKYLEGHSFSFQEYPEKMNKYCGFRWWLSEEIVKKVYQEPNDEKIDKALETFKALTSQNLLDLVFGYKISQLLSFYVKYRFKSFILKIKDYMVSNK